MKKKPDVRLVVFEVALARDALARLFRVALRDTGQSRKVANFLLAWYNGEQNGGWDPADLWSVDAAIADDMILIVVCLRDLAGKYPNDLGFKSEIEAVWEKWRAPVPGGKWK